MRRRVPRPAPRGDVPPARPPLGGPGDSAPQPVQPPLLRAVRHALPAQAVLERLDAPADGLSSAEAGMRLERFGPNRLPPPARRSAVARLVAQFQNVLIYVLLGAAAVAALLGEWKNASVILGVVAINA